MDTTKFTECGGALYRNGAWSAPLRSIYSDHVRIIETGAELRASLRAGPYAWPGCYALAFITSDGGALCFQCARDNLALITASIRQRYSDGWRVVGIIAEHETDGGCDCDNCGKSIWEAKND